MTYIILPSPARNLIGCLLGSRHVASEPVTSEVHRVGEGEGMPVGSLGRQAIRRGGANSRWIALYVLCAGMLMIVLDVTVVNVALPAIQDDLVFSTSSLAWVVNAYMIAFG